MKEVRKRQILHGITYRENLKIDTNELTSQNCKRLTDLENQFSDTYEERQNVKNK